MMRVVDEQIEMRQKVLAEDASDSPVCGVQLSEVVHHGEYVADTMLRNLQLWYLSERLATVRCCAGDACGPVGWQTELGNQPVINGCDLRACVYQEIEWAVTIHDRGHHN